MVKLEEQTGADIEVENSCQTCKKIHNDPNHVGSCQIKSCEADLTSSTEVGKSSCETTSCEENQTSSVEVENQTSSVEVEKTSVDCMTSQEISTIFIPPISSFHNETGNVERTSITPPLAQSKRFIQEFEIFSTRKRYALNIFNQPHYIVNNAKKLEELVLSHGKNGLLETLKYLKMEKVNLVNGQLNVDSLLNMNYLEGLFLKYKKDKVELDGIIKDQGYQFGCSACNFPEAVSAVKYETHAGASSKNQNLNNGLSLYALVGKLKTVPLYSLEDNIGSLLENNHFKGCSKCSVRLEYTCQHGGGNQLIVNSKFHCNTRLANRLATLFREGSNGSPSLSNHIFSFKDSTMTENVQTKSVDIIASSLEPANTGSISDSNLQVNDLSIAHESSRKRLLLSSSNLPELDSPETQGVRAVHDGPRKRTNEMHKSIFMELQDGAELFYMSNGKKVLNGYKRENGILCCCCREVVSPSKFEAHAGFSSKRQPYRSIYTASGVSLHALANSLSSKRFMISMDNDCGREEMFVSCTKCDKSFDTGFLKSPSVPADSELFCLSCKNNTRPRRTCTQRQATYKEIELNLKRVMDLPKDIACSLCKSSAFETGNEFSPSSFIFCGQCERLFHIGCLKEYGMCDLQERPIPWYTWLCSPDCKEVHMYLKGLVKSSPHDIHSLSTSHTLKKSLEERGLSSQNEHEVKWHLLSGSNITSDNEALFSKAIAIFTEAFGPILERGNDLIPAMVHGGELSKQHFGGMHCAIITGKSEVVSACLLRVFSRDLAELPLIATDIKCHGMGYFKTLLYVVEQLLRTLKVKTLVLPVDEEAQLFWIDKFGFARMSNYRAKLYAEEHWIVRFKKKIMLEKSFHQFRSTL